MDNYLIFTALAKGYDEKNFDFYDSPERHAISIKGQFHSCVAETDWKLRQRGVRSRVILKGGYTFFSDENIILIEDKVNKALEQIKDVKEAMVEKAVDKQLFSFKKFDKIAKLVMASLFPVLVIFDIVSVDSLKTLYLLLIILIFSLNK